jgi:hypothetical protein
MNIESRFGANKGGPQPSEMLYLANEENTLLAHTLDFQILEEIAYKTSENFDISTRFWSKSRSHRKQMTKPFLPGATTTSLDTEADTSGQAFFTTCGSVEAPQFRGEARSQIAHRNPPHREQPRKACVVHLESGQS